MLETRERVPATEHGTIRVVVADDHAAVRAGVRGILEDNGIEVLAEAVTTREAILHCEAQQPDVLVLDNHLADGSGIACLGPIRKRCPSTRVLVYTGLPGEGVVHEALSAGAHGFLRKSSDIAALVRAVRRTAAGELVIVDPLAQRVRRRIEEGRGPFDLTAREIEVVGKAARGQRNVDIARELFVSPNTVKTHLSSAIAKLGARDRTGAVVKALMEGVIDLTTSGEAEPVNGA